MNEKLFWEVHALLVARSRYHENASPKDDTDFAAAYFYTLASGILKSALLGSASEIKNAWHGYEKFDSRPNQPAFKRLNSDI